MLQQFYAKTLGIAEMAHIADILELVRGADTDTCGAQLGMCQIDIRQGDADFPVSVGCGGAIARSAGLQEDIRITAGISDTPPKWCFLNGHAQMCDVKIG